MWRLKVFYLRFWLQVIIIIITIIIIINIIIIIIYITITVVTVVFIFIIIIIKNEKNHASLKKEVILRMAIEI